jgi:small-conductance mechanosensitive channel
MVRFDNFAAAYQLRAYTDKPNEYQRIQSEVRKNIYDVFKDNNLNMVLPNVLKSV